MSLIEQLKPEIRDLMENCNAVSGTILVVVNLLYFPFFGHSRDDSLIFRKTRLKLLLKIKEIAF